LNRLSLTWHHKPPDLEQDTQIGETKPPRAPWP
jgi:hypothetical protein